MEKIKLFIKYCAESDTGKDILVSIIVILVGTGSFGLGRLSKNSFNPGIKIEYENQPASAVIGATGEIPSNSSIYTSPQNGKNFFASNRGRKYYSVGCPGGETIKQENRIYFVTAEEAKQAGYELSSSCQ